MPEQIPKPALQLDKKVQVAVREKFSLDAQKPLLALCPGAEFGPAKQWPAKHYATLASEKLKAGWQAGWQVALLGSAADKGICAEINAACDGLCTDLAG